ncbi:MAG: bifunctional nuclease family protein [Planctomycetes bacterium]|nr:bifunctional nuclease family protein [Planctomycetota bacterium]
MPEQLHKISIKKVLGPINAGTAVLLGNDEKTFVMFIGTYEGAAILRELNDETPPRPMTHDLLSYVLSGFDITVKQIVISDIVDNTFCATLVLEQKCVGKNAEWSGKRNEVRIDARPSDCLVLALKEKVDIWATSAVLEKVHDISEGVQFGGLQGAKPQGPFGLKELDLSGLKDQLESFNIDDMLEKDPEDAEEDDE